MGNKLAIKWALQRRFLFSHGRCKVSLTSSLTEARTTTPATCSTAKQATQQTATNKRLGIVIHGFGAEQVNAWVDGQTAYIGDVLLTNFTDSLRETSTTSSSPCTSRTASEAT